MAGPVGSQRLELGVSVIRERCPRVRAVFGFSPFASVWVDRTQWGHDVGVIIVRLADRRIVDRHIGDEALRREVLVDEPSAKPPSAADIAAATARYEDARVAFNKGRGTVESARLQAAFVEATITLERLTGSLVGITPENRKAFGLGDNPGERLNNG